jgi:hypothetical protein
MYSSGGKKIAVNKNPFTLVDKAALNLRIFKLG